MYPFSEGQPMMSISVLDETCAGQPSARQLFTPRLDLVLPRIISAPLLEKHTRRSSTQVTLSPRPNPCGVFSNIIIMARISWVTRQLGPKGIKRYLWMTEEHLSSSSHPPLTPQLQTHQPHNATSLPLQPSPPSSHHNNVVLLPTAPDPRHRPLGPA